MTRTRAQYERLRMRPEWVARNRARNAAWCAEHRNVRGKQPWLAGAPPFGPFLPGCLARLDLDPAGRWPLVLRNVRHLHGVISHLVAEGHGRFPAFSILPWGNHWYAYLGSETAQSLAARAHPVNVFHEDRLLVVGPRIRIKSPSVNKRGRQLVRVDAITPVVTRSDGAYRTSPDVGRLLSSASEVGRRMGVVLGIDDLRAELVDRSTFPENVDVGGHWGVIRGWVGSASLMVNAPMRWLLEVGARIGFGGRTAIGFGRIVVTDVEVT